MMSDADMPALVRESIEAHGGLERWQAIDQLAMKLSTGGLAFASKFKGRAMRDVRAEVSTKDQLVVFSPYPTSGRRGIFHRGSVRIESSAGDLIGERPDARSAFRTLRHRFWWDDYDMLYFCGYALWTYMSVPFVLAGPGFGIRELDPMEDRGEPRRRISVSFPPGIHTHCREQTFWLDERGLIRRHDYTAEPFGGWARAAHYCAGHKTVDGLTFGTSRRVVPRRGDQPRPRPTLVWIEITDLNPTMSSTGSSRERRTSA